MMSSFTVTLESRLMRGAASFSDSFINRHAGFAASVQMDDGGFTGRGSSTDIYYSDFALRTLALLGRLHTVDLHAAARYVESNCACSSLSQCYNVLNCIRLLNSAGVRAECRGSDLASILEKHRLATGGFARAGGKVASAYNTFLAALCHEMLGIPYPAPGLSADAMTALQRANGGYAETSTDSASQTNATAAAAAFLIIAGEDSRLDAARTAEFISSMQAEDGGIRAHAAVECGDLLSTFTGMVAVVSLNLVNMLDLPRAARFLKSVECPAGGFASCIADTEPDVEYTYYGVATASLLRTLVQTRTRHD